MSRDPNLFSSSAAERSVAGAPGAGGGPGGETGGATSIAGTGSDPSAGGGSGGGVAETAGSASGGASGGPGAGAGGVLGQGGSNALQDCALFGGAAVYLPSTQHCYLAVREVETFDAAQARCAALGAHLVTLTSAEENAFAWDLSPTEHWIFSRDGKGLNEQRPGTYQWLDGEPFVYSAWSRSQPDAAETDCGDTYHGEKCYEHCAFQWTGGERPGQWNDRFCVHTIESICEWDSAPEP